VTNLRDGRHISRREGGQFAQVRLRSLSLCRREKAMVILLNKVSLKSVRARFVSTT
jgi:hypothetical protein